MARPSIYSPELAGAICERLARGSTLVDIVDEDGMPSYTTVCKWRRELPEFAQMYAHARDDQADFEFDEIKRLADELPWMVDAEDGGDTNHKAGGSRVDTGHVAHMKTRIDVRKWRAAKMRPKVYADKVDTTVSGPDGGPVQTTVRVLFGRD